MAAVRMLHHVGVGGRTVAYDILLEAIEGDTLAVILDNQIKGREVTIHSARTHVNQVAQTVCWPPSCKTVSITMFESPE